MRHLKPTNSNNSNNKTTTHRTLLYLRGGGFAPPAPPPPLSGVRPHLEQQPQTAPGLLSNQEKDLLIERAFLGLYRWYVSRSQATRNWNPDLDINWRQLRTDHSEKLNNIIEGFFAVEQYVPDYVLTLLKVIRRSHGRSHFHIRWGSEEEKHAELWENALIFSRFRTPKIR